MVLHQGGPAGVVNTKALAHSGITRDTPDPPAGRIVQGPADRRADGDDAQRLLGPQGPALRRLWRRRHAGRRAREDCSSRRYNERGITSIGDRGASVAALKLYRSSARSRRADRPGQRHADPEPAVSATARRSSRSSTRWRATESGRAERADRRRRSLGPDRPDEGLPRRRHAQRHGLHARALGRRRDLPDHRARLPRTAVHRARGPGDHRRGGRPPGLADDRPLRRRGGHGRAARGLRCTPTRRSASATAAG